MPSVRSQSGPLTFKSRGSYQKLWAPLERSNVLFVFYVLTLQFLEACLALNPCNLVARLPLYGPGAHVYFYP